MIFGAIAGAVAGPGKSGFWWGFFLGPVGVIVAAILRLDKPTPAVAVMPTEETKRCPDCAETILVAARKCRYCGADVSASVPAPIDPSVAVARVEYHNGPVPVWVKACVLVGIVVIFATFYFGSKA